MEVKVYLTDGSVTDDIFKVRNFSDVDHVEVVETLTVHEFIQKYVV